MNEEAMPHAVTNVATAPETMHQRYLLILSLLLLPLFCGGCIGGARDDGTSRATSPRYRDLQNQTVAVMVWAERGIQFDFPPVQLDVTSAVQRKLSESRAREVNGTTFPINPRSIVRRQQDQPDLQRRPIGEVAHTFGVSRLIYIEIDRFDTRAETAAELYRGSAAATVRVVEVDPDGSSRIAYEERDIHAVFPPAAPPDGIADATDLLIYRGLIDQLSDAIASRFVQLPTRR
jgi:hypothetical protein